MFISIIEDDKLESTELFSVVIQPSDDPALNFNDTIVDIGILNDDCESSSYEYSVFVTGVMIIVYLQW